MGSDKIINKINSADNLDQLLAAVRAAETAYLASPNGFVAASLRDCLERIYCDLPAWGPAPADTEEVYSWDAIRYLVWQNGWQLVPRSDD